MNLRTLVLVLAAFVAFFTFHGSKAVNAEPTTKAEEVATRLATLHATEEKRDRAARDVCGGQAFEWDAEGSLVCHREIQGNAR